MKDYVIITDSGCDIAPEVLARWGVPYVSLTFRFEDEDREYRNDDMPAAEFYARMRAGGSAKTAAINIEGFKTAFRPILESGRDLLYLGFSSGLSATYHASTLAAEELREEFPDRTILTEDTLCASSGQGLLVRLALDRQEAGAAVEDVACFVRENRLKLCHWFTVDDLVYLKRGGRVSPAVAFVGGMLGIKPILHVDEEGHLISRGKVRGRKASLQALADKYGELAENPGGDTVYICQGDCRADAESLAAMLREKWGTEVAMITDVGPVIGSHSGPGTIAVFFVGKYR